MMRYSDFYDIAEYGNKHWRGKFTPKETAENAFGYWLAFQSSKPTQIANDIKILLDNLDADNTEEARYFATSIREELEIC